MITKTVPPNPPFDDGMVITKTCEKCGERVRFVAVQPARLPGDSDTAVVTVCGCKGFQP